MPPVSYMIQHHHYAAANRVTTHHYFMQNPLFGEPEKASVKPVKKSGKNVEPVIHDPVLITLAKSLPAHLRLGTSSWSYPGWDGLVWDGEYAATNLSRYGLPAYAQHPLFRTVSIDRNFYRPMNVAQFAEHAAQVGQDFRFVVKAPSLVTDALVRDESGRGMRQNSNFLNAEQAVQMFVEPALEGLGEDSAHWYFKSVRYLLHGLGKCQN